MLSADRPIEGAAEDRLRRAPFARALAEDIRSAPRDSGFVVGLTGSWGEGKTSVLRMIEEDLLPGDAAAVVRFNPWLFSGTEQLVEHFFTEVAGQLAHDGASRLEGIAKALQGYGRIVTPLRYLPYVGEVARITAEAAGDLGKTLSGEQPPDTARERARQLREQLADLEKPIVVFVDDLDRLRDGEIADVVRLVRLVGDFPNIVYVLAFDRPVVERSLGGGDRGRGRAYLDKIVHVSHELPRVRSEDLTQLLQEAVADAIGDPALHYFDRERVTNLFWGGVRELFSTVRDVRRYANVLPGALRPLGDEVALADVLALEAIRLFEPECFEAIVEARQDLTAMRPAGGVGGDADAEANGRVRAIPARASKAHRVAIEEVLRRLFPLAERHFGGTAYSESSVAEWRGERRVASGEVLSVYLHKRLPPGTLPARDVEHAVGLLGDREKLDELFGSLSPEELEGLLARLVEYERKFPAEDLHIAISAVLRQRHRFSRRTRFGDRSSDAVVLQLVHRLLRNRDREAVAADVARIEFPDLSSRYEVVRMVGYREGSGRRLVDEEIASSAERALAEAIVTASAADLARERDLGPLIAFTQQLQPAVLRERLDEWLGDDQFMVELVGVHQITSLSNTVGEAAVRRTVQLDWPSLVRLVGIGQLCDRLTVIDRSWVEREFDDDTSAVWRQALRYIADPEAGDRDSRRFRAGDEEQSNSVSLR